MWVLGVPMERLLVHVYLWDFYGYVCHHSTGCSSLDSIVLICVSLSSVFVDQVSVPCVYISILSTLYFLEVETIITIFFFFFFFFFLSFFRSFVEIVCPNSARSDWEIFLVSMCLVTSPKRWTYLLNRCMACCIIAHLTLNCLRLYATAGGTCIFVALIIFLRWQNSCWVLHNMVL